MLGIVPEQLERDDEARRDEGLMRLLIELRAEARARKDWATADQIREQLAELGITLEDRADGTIWKIT